MKIYLDTLAELAGGRWASTQRASSASGMSFDTRTLKAGELFLALEGPARDGHTFLEQAQRQQASAALVSRADMGLKLPQLIVKDPLAAVQTLAKKHRQSFPHPLVGVTGSCGKTSTKDLLKLLLDPEYTHANTLSFNGKLGVPLTLLGLDAQRHRFAVIEAGISEPGDMALLEPLITPDHVLFTNIAPTHLEYLESPENVAAQKSLLAQKAPGYILIHAEDLRYPALQALEKRAWIAQPGTQAQKGKLTYQLASRPDLTAELSLWLPDGQDARFSLACLSDGQQRNAVLALALALALGHKAAQLQERLALWQPSEKRGEILRFAQQTVFLDAYNANPASMADTLSFFQKRFPEATPRLYIVGSMFELGPQSPAYHKALGQQLQLRPQDTAWLIGPHAHDILSPAPRVHHYQSPQELPPVSSFHGNILIKGGNSLALWSLV